MGRYERKEWVLTEQEVEDMMERVSPPWMKAMIAILYYSGCRVHEALPLQREDFKQDDDYLYIRFTTLKRKKTLYRWLKFKHSMRYIPYIIQHFKNMEDKRPTALYFKSTHSNKPFTRRAVLYNIHSVNSTAWCHLFRHTRNTIFAKKGATAFELKAWNGWSDLQSAAVYVHDDKKLIDRLAEK